MDEQWKNVILDHYKHPRHYGDMPDSQYSSEQHNRTCGDQVKVFAKMDEKNVSTFRFIGAGCSLCLASASLMMELVQGQTRDEIIKVRDEYLEMWTKGVGEGAKDTWQALSGLRQYPVRSRCVKLSWQALDEILAQSSPV